MPFRVFGLMLHLVLILVLGIGNTGYAQDDFPRQVTDAAGVVVTIPARPQIVAVIGDVPELKLILPHTRQIDVMAPEWSGVGLLVLPDLYAAAYPDVVKSARDADVPVFQTTAVNSLESWRDAVRRLGLATGQDIHAEAAVERLDRQLTLIRERVSGEEPVRALVLTPEGYTFGRGALLTELIDAAGGVNTAAEAGYANYRQIDDSVIHDLAPDVILLSPSWGADGALAFAANPAYSTIPAVRLGRVYLLRFSPTMPPDPGSALVMLALLLHPRALLFGSLTG